MQVQSNLKFIFLLFTVSRIKSLVSAGCPACRPSCRPLLWGQRPCASGPQPFREHVVCDVVVRALRRDCEGVVRSSPCRDMRTHLGLPAAHTSRSPLVDRMHCLSSHLAYVTYLRQRRSCTTLMSFARRGRNVVVLGSCRFVHRRTCVALWDCRLWGLLGCVRTETS